MPTQVSEIITAVRFKLVEDTPRFWSDAELIQHIDKGQKDLWRSIVDLKQEHFVKFNEDVTYPPSSDALAGVPSDVHKVYLIEPVDLTSDSTNVGLVFRPREYNDTQFRSARSLDAIDPTNATIWFAVAGKGTPIEAPTIKCAPQVTSTVNVRFGYIPSLETITDSQKYIQIPGEADNAIVAWTIAYARAKEREDRSPDPGWLTIYATEKSHLLESLGLREYAEPEFVQAVFEEYWG